MELPIEKLRNLVAAGVAKRWGGADGKLLVPQTNIDYEIATIERFGWADYFVMAAEMVDAARKAGGRIGPGRGAVVLLLRRFARFTRDEAEKCRKYISKMMPKRFYYAIAYGLRWLFVCHGRWRGLDCVRGKHGDLTKSSSARSASPKSPSSM